MLAWRHKMALERWAARKTGIRFHNSLGVGEKTFKTALDKGWIKPMDAADNRRWWDRDYEFTAAGQSALTP